MALALTIEQLPVLDDESRSAIARNLAEHFSLASDAAAQAPEEHRASLAALGSILRRGAPKEDAEAFDGIFRVAEDVEGAGALHLAYSMLAHLRVSFSGVDVRRLGSALAVQGRIAREIGDLDSAIEVYSELSTTARERSDPYLVALAAHGLGGIALARGNLPEARARYEDALRSAERAGARDLEGRAHRGLLIVTAKEGDLDAALRHGWAAYERSGDSRNSNAELLGNLAGVCRECGQHAASFAGYSIAVLWADSYRVRIPALGGAVLAAALNADTHHVPPLADRIMREVSMGAPPFESAQALVDLAHAYEAVSDPRVSEVAKRAETISRDHRYFELEHLARALQARSERKVADQTARAPLELSPWALNVVDSVIVLADQTSSISALVGTTG